MATLRAKEIRGMSPGDMDEHLHELNMDLMKIRGVLASGGVPEDVGKVRTIKRTISRILTIKNQNKINKENQKSIKKEKQR